MGKMFKKELLRQLFVPMTNSNGEDNGQLTIIGGSSLFHGAPLLALKTTTRIVDMVFFASPEPSMEKIATTIKSNLSSFIWVPWEDTDDYVGKSDAVLIGNGFMRFGSEKTPDGERFEFCDEECQKTKRITKYFLEKYPGKKWVIDAGSLQVLEPDWIPKHAILTPNKKEFSYLFGRDADLLSISNKYSCTIVLKGPTTLVASEGEIIEVTGGNPGLTKGGTGDVQAGLTAALLTKNNPKLSALTGAYIVKAVADAIFQSKKTYYNADDLADVIPEVFAKLVK